MKKILLKVMTLSVMLVALPGIFVGCKDYDDEISGLQQTDNNLKKEFNDRLTEQLLALQDQEAALKQLKSDLEAQIQAAKSALENAAAADRQKFEAEISAAKARLSTVESTISEIQATQADIQKQINDLKTDMNAIDSKYDKLMKDLEGKVDGINSDLLAKLNALDSKYGSVCEGLLAQIQDLAQRVAQNKEDLENAIATAVADLKKYVDGNFVTNEDLAEMLKKYDDYMTSNDEALATLSARVDAIEPQINTLKEQVAGLRVDVDKLITDLSDLTDVVAGLSGDLKDFKDEYAANDVIVKGLIASLEGRLADLEGKHNAFYTEYLKHIEAYELFHAAYLQHVTDYEEYQTSVNTQLAALNDFMTSATGDIADLKAKTQEIEGNVTVLQSGLEEVKGDLVTMNATIASIQSALAECASKADLDALKGDFNELSTKVEGIDTRLTAAEAAINTINADIVKINGALSTLNSKNAKRLTSVTLIPEAYVSGIPSIEFYTATYHALAAPTEGIYGAASTTATSISSGLTKVSYRLNPTGVQLTDILSDKISFVQQVATSRAAADDVIGVAQEAQPTVENGILTVYAVKKVNENIDNAGNGKIYTVALRVPIAPKNYFTWTDEQGNEVTEDADDAVVYSEYSRLADTEFTPKVAATSEYTEEFKETEVFHLWDNTLFDGATDVPVIEVPFNAESFDLSGVATGCMEYTYNSQNIDMLMDAVQLEAYGLTLAYSVPAKAFEVDGVNQQVYAEVAADGTLTPTQPEDQTPLSRVAKTPIVSVVLMHGNDVVDQRFFMVKYTSDAKATTVEKTFDPVTLSCDDVVNNFTWKALIDSINAKGLTFNQEEFIANYTLKEFTPATGEGTVTYTADAETNPLVWTLGQDQYKNLDGKNAEKQITVVFTNAANLYPDITFVFDVTVNWPTTLPTLGETSPVYWTNGTMRILPVAMPTGWAEGDPVVSYSTNILIGRQPSYLNGLFECANWDLQFSGVSNTEFVVNADELPALDGNGGYEIVMGDNTDAAAVMNHAEADFVPFTFTADDAADKALELPFVINHNDAGIAMVEAEPTVDLTWYVALNGIANENFTKLNNTHLAIIKPLKKLDMDKVKPLQQSTEDVTRELGEGLTITDAYDQAFVSTDLAWKYYNVQEPVFSNNMYLTMNADGTGTQIPLEDLKMSASITGSTLTFTSGVAAIEQTVYLNIPVEVAHEWGVLKQVVTIPINPFGTVQEPVE